MGIRAAMSFPGTEPTDLLLGHRDQKFLGKRFCKAVNRKLKLAWQILKDETDPRCGVPIWLGQSTESYVEFTIEDSKCFACEAMGLDEEKQSKNKHKAHGVTRYPKPGVTKMEGMSYTLPTREEYYKKQMELMEWRRENDIAGK